MNLTEYSFHPISEAFPLMSEPEFTDLCEDLRLNGQRVPIMVFEQQILDGRNRWTACKEIGTDPWIEVFNGSSSQAVDYVISMNLRRRNLTDSQRAMAAAKLANLRRGDNQFRSKEDTQDCGTSSQAEAARLLNVSPRAVSQAKRVLRDGVMELEQKVNANEISLSAADTIAKHPKTKQVRILRKGNDRLASYASRLKVENTLKNARYVHDVCFCHPPNPITKEWFVALMNVGISVLKQNGGSQFAGYLNSIILDEIDELDVAPEYQDLKMRVCFMIREAPHLEADILRKAHITKDELRFTLNTLENYGWVEQMAQGGKTEVARGARKMLWTLTEKGQKELAKFEETVP